jgi:hypothetical protein
VGVSNMAGTLNFICNMKDVILGLIVGILVVAICYCLDRLSKIVITEAVTSSPVEEMYHRQLVNTIDSILDSRYPCGITEDNSAYPSIDSLSSIATPKYN